MWAPLAPVETSAAQGTFRRAVEGGQIDPEPFEEALSLSADEPCAVRQRQVAAFTKDVGQRKRQFAREMIVAGACCAQRFRSIAANSK